MNALDIGIVVVVAVFVLYGAVKGLVRLTLGAVALGLGLFLGCWYNAPMSAMLSGFIKNESARRLTALGLVLLGTIAAFLVLVWFITKTLEAVRLRWIDRLSGAALGFAVASILAAAILVPLTAFLPAQSTLVDGSTLSPYVLKISNFVKALVPEELKQRYDAARAKVKEAGKGLLPGAADVPAAPSVPEIVKTIEGMKPAAGAAADPNAKPAAAPSKKSGSSGR